MAKEWWVSYGSRWTSDRGRRGKEWTRFSFNFSLLELPISTLAGHWVDVIRKPVDIWPRRGKEPPAATWTSCTPPPLHTFPPPRLTWKPLSSSTFFIHTGVLFLAQPTITSPLKESKGIVNLHKIHMALWPPYFYIHMSYDPKKILPKQPSKHDFFLDTLIPTNPVAVLY